MVLYLSNNGIKFEVTTMFYLLLLWYIYLFVIENTKNGWWNWVLKPSISLVMYQANLLSFDLIILSFSLNMFLLKMPKNCWVNFGAFQHSLDGWNPWLYAENGRVGIRVKEKNPENCGSGKSGFQWFWKIYAIKTLANHNRSF